MIGQVAAVNFMAGLAASALFVAIDVEEVEIIFPRAKIGEGGRLLSQHDAWLVTTEAQVILLDVEPGVKALGKRAIEQRRVLAAVGVVARGTVARANRTVEKLGLGELLLHRLMAFAAEVIGAAGEQMFLG